MKTREIYCVGGLLLAVILLAACSNNGRSYVEGAITETLEVEILDNHSKMFTYRLRWPEDQIPTHIGISRNGSDARKSFYEGGFNIGRATYDRLLQNTNYVVAQTGYCREGFFELDRSISRYHLWMRGECKESATADDRLRFGLKQELGVEHWDKR